MSKLQHKIKQLETKIEINEIVIRRNYFLFKNQLKRPVIFSTILFFGLAFGYALGHRRISTQPFLAPISFFMKTLMSQAYYRLFLF